MFLYLAAAVAVAASITALVLEPQPDQNVHVEFVPCSINLVAISGHDSTRIQRRANATRLHCQQSEAESRALSKSRAAEARSTDCRFKHISSQFILHNGVLGYSSFRILKYTKIMLTKQP